MILQQFAPMGIYEILFKFLDSAGQYMGTEGTHPWAQGFPLTTKLPEGPELPSSVEFDWSDLKYPQASGNDDCLQAVVDYYNHFYDAGISKENVCIFAGGRPGIAAILAFMQRDVHVLIEETEYTPYWDMLKLFKHEHSLVPSNPDNQFRPSLNDYQQIANGVSGNVFAIKSNPCNPTGVTWRGDELRAFVDWCSEKNQGAIIDEAYEFFNEQGAESAMKYVRDIDNTDLFVIGAATKGLQAPGIRVGWVVAAKEHIEIFRNYSSIGMGGVSRPSQLIATKLLEIERVTHARQSVKEFFDEQRNRYQAGLTELGIELFTGDGGFYHWGRLPGGLTAAEFNQRVFEHKAAILPGTLCDMHRRGSDSPMADCIRFSFGPILPETYQQNLDIMRSCLAVAETI